MTNNEAGDRERLKQLQTGYMQNGINQVQQIKTNRII